MALRTWVKAAGAALGTQALATGMSLSDKMNPTVKDQVTDKWMEDPNNPGDWKLVPHFEQVEVPGLPFEQAIGPAADIGVKAGAAALAGYVAYKGAKRLHSALGKQWRK